MIRQENKLASQIATLAPYMFDAEAEARELSEEAADVYDA
jgi:hypothetical protein